MMRSLCMGIVTIVVGCSVPAVVQAADTLLAAPFQDHAVLQRGRPLQIWGTSAPGERIAVSLGHASAHAIADASGHWQATLPAQHAGGPYTLTARVSSGANQSIVDILIGDVWLCSGQSNMELQVLRALDSANEIGSANNDSIRMLTIRHATSPVPLHAIVDHGQWLPATSANVGDFSAVCYYFARELQKTVNVPMGLIHSAWSGSNIRPWLSEKAVRAIGGRDRELAILTQFARDPAGANAAWGMIWQQWWKGAALASDGEPWSGGKMTGSEWRRAPAVLDYWQHWGVSDLAHFDHGMMWLRTSVNMTAAQAAQAGVLSIGPIDEVDQTWLNGAPIGTTSSWLDDRNYAVPAGRFRGGENVIVVNALNTYGLGGMFGPVEKRAIRLADGTAVPLNGPWFYQVVPARIGDPPRAPWDAIGGVTMVGNAMIAPLGPYGLRGVLWYQGESNVGDGPLYTRELAGLMQDWRARFGQDLSFLIVQLPNYMAPSATPSESGWADIREAQRQAVANDAHAALAVTIDIGDRYDIHPANKQEVGRRLARAARHLIYGGNAAPAGPVPRGATRMGAAISVEFGDVEGALVANGGVGPVGFQLCTVEAGSCRFTNARLDNNRVVLDGDNAATATRVRYCWADNPVCTLSDGSGLPAGPFEISIR